MKTLIYSLALFTSFLLAPSCKKDDGLPSINKPQVLDTTKKVQVVNSACDTTKLINIILNNSSSVGSFEIAFSGPREYTFTFPARGGITVAVKPGTYTVRLYAPGNYANYTLNLTGSETEIGSGAVFNNVEVNPCAGPQFATIVPIDRNNP